MLTSGQPSPASGRFGPESCYFRVPAGPAWCCRDAGAGCRAGKKARQSCNAAIPRPEDAQAGLLAPADLRTARRSALLSHLPGEAQARLLKGARTQGLAVGQTLFLQDEPSEALFIVLDGWIKLYRMAPSGNEAVVGTLGAGQSFGESSALCGQPRQVSAAAIGPARLLRLEAGRLRGMLQSDPGLAVSMLAPALTHLHRLATHVEELKARTTLQRAAEFLLALAAESEGEPEVTLPYSKALIAGRLGMKPETLSRAFARLRDHGVRVEATTARIEDVERLQALVAAEIACVRDAARRLPG